MKTNQLLIKELLGVIPPPCEERTTYRIELPRGEMKAMCESLRAFALLHGLGYDLFSYSDDARQFKKYWPYWYRLYLTSSELKLSISIEISLKTKTKHDKSKTN